MPDLVGKHNLSCSPTLILSNKDTGTRKQQKKKKGNAESERTAV